MFVPEPSSQLHRLIRSVAASLPVYLHIWPFREIIPSLIYISLSDYLSAVAGCWVADQNLWTRSLCHKTKEERVSYEIYSIIMYLSLFCMFEVYTSLVVYFKRSALFSF